MYMCLYMYIYIYTHTYVYTCVCVFVEKQNPRKSYFIREIISIYIENTNGYWVMSNVKPITQLTYYLINTPPQAGV